ncbi:hypothetical protein EsH8_IV_000322 [Colletotrichum jinshuiense]
MRLVALFALVFFVATVLATDYLVILKDGVDLNAFSARLESDQIYVLNKFPGLQMLHIQTDGEIAALMAYDEVAAAEEDAVLGIEDFPAYP